MDVAGVRRLRHAAAKLVTLPVLCYANVQRNGALGPGPLLVKGSPPDPALAASDPCPLFPKFQA